ncbi:MAG: hypothetical protein IKZ45_01425 [Fibrobacter sp.]|nr:hypothetical protein [Fibrobacter sp.]
MGHAGFKSVLALVATLLLATGAFAADDESRVEHDRARLSIFGQASVSFLNFEERSYFQNAVDTIYADFRSQAVDAEESLYVAKQNFQKVNFCFPIMAGIQYQVFNDQFISAGIGYIYDNESVVLTDRKNKAHNYSYTIQGVPMFLEYRLAIPTSLITLSNGGLFSIAFRWYWTLPGTEIYTTWGKIEAENKPWGAGFGVSLGYLIASWNGINLYGDIGFSSISVESKESFADIVPDGPTEKAKWNIGGLQLQIRASFGIINKKVVVGDTTAVKDTTAKVGTLAPAAKQPAVDSTETKPANKAEAKPAGAEPPAASTKPPVAGEEPPAAKPPESEINATKEKAAQ